MFSGVLVVVEGLVFSPAGEVRDGFKWLEAARGATSKPDALNGKWVGGKKVEERIGGGVTPSPKTGCDVEKGKGQGWIRPDNEA